MKAINDVVENTDDFIGMFRENVIRVIGNHSTKNITTEHDKQIEELENRLLELIAENSIKGSNNTDYDEEYRSLSEKIYELKQAKLRLVRVAKEIDDTDKAVEDLDNVIKNVQPDIREFDKELVKRLIQNIKVTKNKKLIIQFYSGIVMEVRV